VEITRVLLKHEGHRNEGHGKYGKQRGGDNLCDGLEKVLEIGIHGGSCDG
jgi:hypothetical protein